MAALQRCIGCCKVVSLHTGAWRVVVQCGWASACGRGWTLKCGDLSCCWPWLRLCCCQQLYYMRFELLTGANKANCPRVAVCVGWWLAAYGLLVVR